MENGYVPSSPRLGLQYYGFSATCQANQVARIGFRRGRGESLCLHGPPLLYPVHHPLPSRFGLECDPVHLVDSPLWVVW